MRIAAFGDIHSNSHAFRACLDRAEEIGIDACVLLGDYVSDCAYPERTVDIMHEIMHRYPAYVVRGNREEYLLNHKNKHSSDWTYNSRTGSLLYTYDNLSSSALDYFASLPISAVVTIPGEAPFEIAHGSFSKSRGMLLPGHPDAESAFREMSTGYLLCAHTHTRFLMESEGKLIANGGVIGIPSSGDLQAGFLILESKSGKWFVSFENADYDRGLVIREIIESGLINKAPVWARGIIASLKTGNDYCLNIIRLVESYSRETGLYMDDESLWEKAAKTLGI